MLKAFLKSLPDDAARREWAVSCGTTLGHLRNCVYQPKPPAPETCVLVERNSGNQVRRWHLRPLDWYRIWPELIGVHGAPIVGDQHQTVSTGRGTAAAAARTDRHDVAAGQFPAPQASQQGARDAA